MIGIPQAVRIWLFTAPTDMRKGFDGLSGPVMTSGHDVYGGYLFVFLSRRRDRAKILTFEKGGFVLWCKRLKRGRSRPITNSASDQVTLDSAELTILLDGIDLSRVERPKHRRPKNDSQGSTQKRNYDLRCMGITEILDEPETTLTPAAGELVVALRQAIEELTAKNARLGEQVEMFQRMLFGKRSEKMASMESEVRRRVEAGEMTVEGKPMPDEPKARARERRRKARKKSAAKRKKKRSLRKNLPVLTEPIHVQPNQLPDGLTLEDFRELGERELIRRLDHVREHLVMVEYHLQTLASRDNETIVKARTPPGVVDGGHHGPGLYARPSA